MTGEGPDSTKSDGGPSYISILKKTHGSPPPPNSDDKLRSSFRNASFLDCKKQPSLYVRPAILFSRPGC